MEPTATTTASADTHAAGTAHAADPHDSPEPPKVPDTLPDEAGETPAWVPQVGLGLLVLFVGAVLWHVYGDRVRPRSPANGTPDEPTLAPPPIPAGQAVEPGAH